MSKYRVTLPIDFGDGAVHLPGEIVEPDLSTAQAYRHALVQVETDATGLALTIRGIRLRLGLNMTKFGKVLGVTHTQVSRYESGRSIPGYFPLWQLLAIADGAEKNPFLKYLGKMLPQPPIENVTETRLRAEYQKHGFAVPDAEDLALDRRYPHVGVEGAKQGRSGVPATNLEGLVQAVMALCARGEEVDASLVRIVRLWLSADSSDPAVRQRFADAATYLEVGLAPNTSASTPQKPKKMA